MSAAHRRPVGFVLAGGASRRFGTDKALLPWGRTTLLAHALDRLAQVCARVEVLCGAQRRYEDLGVPLRTDLRPGAGPLGGLLTGVEAAGGAPALFLPVDTPFVPSALLAALVEALPGYDAVIPATSRGPEPVCGLYGPGCATPMATAVATGRLHATSFWDAVRVQTLGEDALRAWGDPDTLFANVNTRADLERARALRES